MTAEELAVRLDIHIDVIRAAIESLKAKGLVVESKSQPMRVLGN